jgi:UDP-N-acetylmuramate--alanine ligase
MIEKKRHIHCVGIGGAGMSGLAEVLLTLGHRVSGSDLKQSETTMRLERLGGSIFIGHSENHVAEDTDVVVISTAVKFSNPEVVRSRALRIPVIPRAEMLAELMRMKDGIAIAGSHGKTTTTSMIATVLARAGLDPTVVIGGRLGEWGGNARLGLGKILVAEADESDGTFLLLSPTIAVVTNIDTEHLDHYGSMAELEASFLAFINRVPFYGLAVLGLDHPRIRSLLRQVNKPFVTYGWSAEADFTAQALEHGFPHRFEVSWRQKKLGVLTLHLPGRHFASNALASVAVAQELGIPFSTVETALASFQGVDRRFEIKAETKGILIVDDYGHHPEEVRATLRAARETFQRRLVVVFQPHRYTRTQALFHEFLSAFDDADLLVMTSIYPAGEEPIPGVRSEALYQAIRRRGHLEVRFVADKESIVSEIAPLLRSGDLFLTLGAGDIHRVADDLIQELRT